MADQTYAEQLSEIKVLIKKIQDGENASGGAMGRSWTKLDLETLYTREKYLTRMATREANGGKINSTQVVPL
jgi:hypothetical protein